MSGQLKQEWITALRSGDYQQGFYRLHDFNGYCCLGVLADILIKKGILSYDALAGRCLSPGVLPQHIQTTLAQMNDKQRKSFNEIADYIDVNIKPTDIFPWST